MDDGHTGLASNQVNQGESGNFKLVLSTLKQSTGQTEFVIHVTSNVIYSFGADHFQFLSKIGFSDYRGQCPFLQGRCFYHVLAQTQRSFFGMEHLTQVQLIHDSFKRFAASIHQLFMLYEQEETILREIGLEPSSSALFGQPIQIEIQDTDIPLWVNEVKFPKLRELNASR